MRSHPYWPLFDLRLRTADLELRYATEEDLIALAGAAAAGVHEPDFMPFANAWTRKLSPELERGVLQWHWNTRACWKPDNWFLELVVVHRGEVVGSQSLRAEHFAQVRSVGTGSWLTQAWQGRGLGKHMRAAVLHLAFAGLGAQEATTEAFEGNAASLGVTKSLGYQPNGTLRKHLTDEPAEHPQWRIEHLFRMTRHQWEHSAARHYPVTVEGLEPCLPLFGVKD